MRVVLTHKLCRLACHDLSRCNADHSDGCTPLTFLRGLKADSRGLAVNPVTHEVYVTDNATDQLQAFHGAPCNALVRSGCMSPPTAGAIGHRPYAIATDASTNTVYVTAIGENGDGHTVSVVDGSRCCTATATVERGRFPIALDVDPPTHTLYVANQALDD